MPHDDDYREVQHFEGNVCIEVEDREGENFLISFGIEKEDTDEGNMVLVTFELPSFTPINQLGSEFHNNFQSVNPPPEHNDLVKISAIIPCDTERRWARNCKKCGGLFRADEFPTRFHLTCCYCGHRDYGFNYLTTSQYNFARASELVKQDALRSTYQKNSVKLVKYSFNEIENRAKIHYRKAFHITDTTQQNEFFCERCGHYNDIMGIFSFCFACGSRNTLDVVLTKFDKVILDIDAGRAAIPDAFRDCVSVFSSSCRDLMKLLVTNSPPSSKENLRLAKRHQFHNFNDQLLEIFRSEYNIDLLRYFSQEDKILLRTLLAKRHVFEHNYGTTDQKYIDDTGDTTFKIGETMRVSSENLDKLRACLRSGLPQAESA